MTERLGIAGQAVSGRNNWIILCLIRVIKSWIWKEKNLFAHLIVAMVRDPSSSRFAAFSVVIRRLLCQRRPTTFLPWTWWDLKSSRLATCWRTGDVLCGGIKPEGIYVFVKLWWKRKTSDKGLMLRSEWRNRKSWKNYFEEIEAMKDKRDVFI